MNAFILAAFVLSGACGLIYEVVWTRALSVLVGGTALASQAVLATFFAGTTVGAFWLGGRLARSENGARSYARLEGGIAVAGLVSVVVLGLAQSVVATLTDGQATAGTALVALLVTACACFPATVLMGATYPAATRAFEQSGSAEDSGRRLGLAYAANTAGAVLGAVGAAFVLLPGFGARATLGVAVLGNLTAALLARTGSGSQSVDQGVESRLPPAAGPVPKRILLGALASGLAGISLQIVAIRILAVTLHDSVYTFAVAVGAYIAGAALGALLFSRLSGRILDRLGAGAPAVVFSAAAVLSAFWLLTLRWGAPVAAWLSDGSVSFFDRVTTETTVSLLLATPIAIPTTWAFLTLARASAPNQPAVGAGIATAWNGIGCAVAPVLSSVLLLPIGGSRAVAIFALCVLLLSAAGLVTPEPAPRRLGVYLAVLFATALPVWFVRDGLFDWLSAEGYHLIWRHEGASQAVAVEASPTGQRRLRTNNNFTEGGDAALLIQLRQGLLPTLFRPHAARVLVMGVGSGGTLAGVVGGLPEAQVDAVELVPEVSRALGFFDELHGGIQRNPKVKLNIADARTFAAHAAQKGSGYDLVVGELFHAQQAGTGALYAREHFQNVRRALGAGGLYCQWVPLHETPPNVVPMIVRTFFSVFPKGAAFFGTWNLRTPILGLMGTEADLSADWVQVKNWLAADPLRARRAKESKIDDLADTFATFLGSADAMRSWAGQGAMNTDDRPEMEFLSPRGAGDAIGIENVLSLLPVRRLPTGMLSFGDERNRMAVAALQTATAHFYRGSEAWRRDDLEGAETGLRAALVAAPSFDPARRGLGDLVKNWRIVKRSDRADALAAWLAQR